MRRRLKARKVIPIGILAVCLLLMYKVFWLDKHIEKEKAVLYVEVVEEFEKKIRKENCIIIPDCKEYLTDYASEDTRRKGESLIEEELKRVASDRIRQRTEENLKEIEHGTRDFRF